MDSESNVTTGQRLRQIRYARGKSLRVIAGLSGVLSAASLSRIENGLRALDRRSEIVALANALQISPSELIGLPVAAPGDERADAAVRVVRAALLAAARGRADGQVLPVEALRARVRATATAFSRCDRDDEVGAALPDLIRDVHTSIAAGRDVAELLDLAVLLHTEVTTGWLRVAGAPVDLRSQAVLLGHQVAQDRDTPTALGLAVWGGVHLLVAAGSPDLALAELDSVTVPMTSLQSMQLAGMLALCRSLVAAADNRPGDVDAPLERAAELATRTGEGNAYWMGFGPTNVGCWPLRARDRRSNKPTDPGRLRRANSGDLTNQDQRSRLPQLHPMQQRPSPSSAHPEHPRPDRERLTKAEVRSDESAPLERGGKPWSWTDRALAFPTRTLGTHGLSLTRQHWSSTTTALTSHGLPRSPAPPAAPPG